ncbi:MAG: zinc-ribbon domain-containing protein [Pseudomonadota bacterium]
MRLICPNCGAQYEVGAGVIPDGGRDVQCSNCGQTWFQEPEAVGAPPEPEAVPEPAPVDPVYDEPPAPGSTVSPDVANILREEAQHEQRARQAERHGAIETQTDLGFEQEQPPARSGRDRLARLRGADPATEPEEEGEVRDVVAQMVATSRDLLPDIEEINSTLTATSEQKEQERIEEAVDAETSAARRRTGFRLGFGLSVLVFVLLIGTYLFAPSLGRTVPSAEPAITAYADWANGARVSLDGWLKSTVESLTQRMSDAVADG